MAHRHYDWNTLLAITAACTLLQACCSHEQLLFMYLLCLTWTDVLREGEREPNFQVLTWQPNIKNLRMWKLKVVFKIHCCHKLVKQKSFLFNLQTHLNVYGPSLGRWTLKMSLVRFPRQQGKYLVYCNAFNSFLMVHYQESFMPHSSRFSWRWFNQAMVRCIACIVDYRFSFWMSLLLLWQSILWQQGRLSASRQMLRGSCKGLCNNIGKDELNTLIWGLAQSAGLGWVWPKLSLRSLNSCCLSLLLSAASPFLAHSAIT